MKRLTILRHAKSSWDEPNRDDFDRPLNERGWKAARRIGRELKRRGMRFDCALASTAARVRETLDGLAQGYGDLPFPVRFEQRLYLAELGTLMELIRDLPVDAGEALIAGHNPGLHQLVLELSGGGRLRSRAAEKFPTAAVAVIELAAGDWRDVTAGSGTLSDLILPKELD
jgi:phosphohistidine phosphatase